MPLPTRPAFLQPEPAAASHFIDRVPESEALREALLDHVTRCAGTPLADGAHHNLVTYYGFGGIGKSRLSQQLEAWLTGSSVEGWNAPPAVAGVHTARWELNDSRGNIDVIPLMAAIRSALHDVKPSWPAFDLAFAAYFTSVRPNEQLPVHGLRRPEYADGIISSLAAIAEDLGHANLLIALTSSSVRHVVDAVRKATRDTAAKQTNPDLDDLLTRCLTRPSPTEPAADIAAEVLWQLSLELADLDPASRPNLVVFIDHFERVQNAMRGTGEATINRFVAALPLALFVLTGRNLVDWYRDERIDLPVAGRARWPALTPGVSTGARQHLLDRLSDDDTRALIRRHRDREGLRLGDDVIDEIVRSTLGWPVHIDAVAAYARRLAEKDPDRQLLASDLGGSLETVVGKLVDDLPEDERRVLQAACVLPFFDVPLVQAVAGDVDAGSVERCIRRALILQNPGSAFPYRVHDAIRAAVRSASGGLTGGWSGTDWQAAAMRGLDHIRARYEAAKAAGADQEQLLATALALHLVAENGGDAGWVGEAIRLGPNLTGLRPHSPASDRLDEGNPVRSAVEFIELLDEPAGTHTIDGLLALKDDPVIGLQAHLWAAYRLRDPLYRYDEAIAIFEELRRRDADREQMHRRQIAVTLGQGRRFRDGIAALQQVASEVAKRNTMGVWERAHGDLTRLRELEDRANSTEGSRRYQIEIRGTYLNAAARAGAIGYDALLMQLDEARAVGHRFAERSILKSIGYFQLFHPEEFASTVDALTQLRSAHGDSPAEAELLALRALATHRQEFADEAYEYASRIHLRSAAWIPMEIFLDLAGRPLPPTETQWLEPYEVVRERWRGIADGIIDRAGERTVPS